MTLDGVQLLVLANPVGIGVGVGVGVTVGVGVAVGVGVQVTPVIVTVAVSKPLTVPSVLMCAVASTRSVRVPPPHPGAVSVKVPEHDCPSGITVVGIPPIKQVSGVGEPPGEGTVLETWSPVAF